MKLPLERLHGLCHSQRLVTHHRDSRRTLPFLIVHELVQFPAKTNTLVIQRRVTTENPLASEVRFAVDAEPNLPRHQMRVEEKGNDVTLQNAVTVVRDDVLANVEETDVGMILVACTVQRLVVLLVILETIVKVHERLLSRAISVVYREDEEERTHLENSTSSRSSSE